MKIRCFCVYLDDRWKSSKETTKESCLRQKRRRGCRNKNLYKSKHKISIFSSLAFICVVLFRSVLFMFSWFFFALHSITTLRFQTRNKHSLFCFLLVLNGSIETQVFVNNRRHEVEENKWCWRSVLICSDFQSVDPDCNAFLSMFCTMTCIHNDSRSSSFDNMSVD